MTLAGQHKGAITSLAWNLDGTLIATACKDKMLRILDPRGKSVGVCVCAYFVHISM